jgi:hypothetical protein
LDEKQAIDWLDALDERFTDTQAAKNGEDDVWAAIYSEMRAALETILPPGHVVLRQWQDAVKRANAIQKGNRVQVPERWVGGELLGILRTAISLLKAGHLRSLADGIRAETVAQCLDQAESLVRSGYVVAAMVLAGGGLRNTSAQPLFTVRPVMAGQWIYRGVQAGVGSISESRNPEPGLVE